MKKVIGFFLHIVISLSIVLSMVIIVGCVSDQEPVRAVKSSEQQVSPKLEEMELQKISRAIFYNQLQDVSRIVTERPSVLYLRGSDGALPSHWAAGINSLPILKLIADRAPDTLSSPANDGSTPAFIAAQENSVECLGYFVNKVPESLNIKRKDGGSPAHIAASRDCADSLRFMAEQAPQCLNAKDNLGNTPTHYACAQGSVDSLLILVGQLNEQQLNENNSLGKTPLDLARENNQDACIKLLMGQKLSNHEIGVPDGEDWVHVITTPMAARLSKRWTSLHLAEAQIEKKPRATGGQQLVVVGGTGSMGANGPWDVTPSVRVGRLMFFTSAKNPLRSVEELKPEDGEFGFWDLGLFGHAFHFLAKMGLVPPEKREGFSLPFQGNLSGLFSGNSRFRLFLTYSIFEDTIRENGGVPVRFIADGK